MFEVTLLVDESDLGELLKFVNISEMCLNRPSIQWCDHLVREDDLKLDEAVTTPKAGQLSRNRFNSPTAKLRKRLTAGKKYTRSGLMAMYKSLGGRVMPGLPSYLCSQGVLERIGEGQYQATGATPHTCAGNGHAA